jgi:hypothetical protein
MTISIKELREAKDGAAPGPWPRAPMWPDIPLSLSGITVSIFPRGQGGQEAEANTQLVLSAPDMAEALLAANEAIGALLHERDLACQDMGQQLAASKAADEAVAAYREKVKT